MTTRGGQIGREWQGQTVTQSDAVPVYDLVVVGGGINGSGIFRDAALRGLRVLLLEKNDFGAGTSAYSSRLIHGGLRYLAQFEFGLVRESLEERATLLHIAPHLVKPLALGLPMYRGSKNPPWVITVGLTLYDWFSGKTSFPGHQRYNKADLLGAYPCLNPQGLQGGAVYYDAQVSFPERLCLENVLSAMDTGNADVLNHAEVTALDLPPDTGKNTEAGLFTLTVQDTVTGKALTVQSSVVVNAGGPWVDALLSRMREPDDLALPQRSADIQKQPPPSNVPPLLGVTLGSHIVVKKFPGAPATALYVEAESDGRPFFILPWDIFADTSDDTDSASTYLIGTTDRRYEGDPDRASATAEEVDYLLRETNRVLPQAQLQQADICYSYAGLRPLPYAPGKNEGAVTRRHIIYRHATDKGHPVPGLYSIVGGKLTTFRSLAEETVDLVLKDEKLRAHPLAKSKPICQTQAEPLPGAIERLASQANTSATRPASGVSMTGSPGSLASLTQIPPVPLARYGARAALILQLADSNRIKNLCAWLGLPTEASDRLAVAAVLFAIETEWACTVSDILLRRTGWAFLPDAGFAAARLAAAVLAHTLGWSDVKQTNAITTYHQSITQRYLSHHPEA